MTSPSHRTSSARLIFPALLAWVAGAALQLQQAELMALEIYGIVVLSALALLAYAAFKNRAFKSRLAIVVTAFALSGFGAWWPRAASVLPLLVLVAGFLMIEQWSVREQVLAAAEIDSRLLADDLPPAAYSDPGFAEYLRSAPPP